MTLSQRIKFLRLANPSATPQQIFGTFMACSDVVVLLKSLYEDFDIQITEEQCKQIRDTLSNKKPVGEDDIITQTIKMACYTDGEINSNLLLKCMLLVERHCIIGIAQVKFKYPGGGSYEVGQMYSEKHFIRLLQAGNSIKTVEKNARLSQICALLEKYLGYGTDLRRAMLNLLTIAYVDSSPDRFVYDRIINTLVPGVTEFDDDFLRLCTVYDDSDIIDYSLDMVHYLDQLAFEVEPKVPYYQLSSLKSVLYRDGAISPSRMEEINTNLIKDIFVEFISDLFPYYPIEGSDLFPFAVQHISVDFAKEVLKDADQLAACLNTEDENGMVSIYYGARSNKDNMYRYRHPNRPLIPQGKNKLL